MRRSRSKEKEDTKKRNDVPELMLSDIDTIPSKPLKKGVKGLSPLSTASPSALLGPGLQSPPPAAGRRRKRLSGNILMLDGNGMNIGRQRVSQVINRTRVPEVYEPRTPKGCAPQEDARFPTSAEEEEASLVSQTSFAFINALEKHSSAVFDAYTPAEVIRHLDNSWVEGKEGGTGEFDHGDIHKETFAQHLVRLCAEAIAIFKREPILVSVTSPVYVFGDIHGNFEDMHFFLKELITFGDLKYTSHSFLFLGDYVDRGPNSLECIAYLLALKVLSPNTVFMLRGNHESPEVNGDTIGYGDQSFKAQCIATLGKETGEEIWREINKVFTYLPISGSIDGKIFAAHGGIPRYSGGEDRRMEVLRSDTNFPRFAVVQAPPTLQEDPATRMYRQITNDLLWSDPNDDEDDPSSPMDAHGFGNNPRGPGTISFGSRAVDQFLENTGFEYIFRAHQEKSEGLKLAKSGRVVTVFSTSDYSGHQNGAGVVFVGRDRIRMIIKQPAGRALRPTSESAALQQPKIADLFKRRALATNASVLDQSDSDDSGEESDTPESFAEGSPFKNSRNLKAKPKDAINLSHPPQRSRPAAKPSWQ